MLLLKEEEEEEEEERKKKKRKEIFFLMQRSSSILTLLLFIKVFVRSKNGKGCTKLRCLNFGMRKCWKIAYFAILAEINIKC